ncbi:MAG: DegV family protein [Lachnospiraceae bacterium]|nr:DegV family protein [Lachnospiraceae bacterium]
MNKAAYQIVSDGSLDLPSELTAEKNIMVVPFYVSFDEVNYKKEMEEIGVREFYQQMVDNPKVYPKSSMPSVQDYADVFMPLAEENIPVICICITTKFSGSMQSALNARELVLETYPKAQITVLDATVNTVLQGLFVLEAARMRDAGMGYEETIQRLEEIKGTGRIFFTIGDMEYLKHGGRIGKLTGVAASVLGIRPLITLKEGEIFPSGIARSRKKSMEKVIELLKQYLQECQADRKEYRLCIGYGYDYEEACAFREHALEELGEAWHTEDIPIYQIGATIGVHTGPYSIGFGIIKRAFAKHISCADAER